ncbi:hypothetical protein [Mycobacterium asiaticum]|uniref:Glycosyltransferase RgtA/B/C/D-like domain-containing protein n=1 Tax=Mycobacterium asiaticum TaxID=1790 RepID=A0A1A3L062_MYCAS|nr:hypothetical protein [Mycobacterium asiaticum]OBJ90635.1 hypothetical protein A5640_23475 [Mycobacterium asiaticum]
MPAGEELTPSVADLVSPQHETASSVNDQSGRAKELTLLTAIACTVFGAKLLVISKLGSPMPILDQWDGEGLVTYVPHLHGTYSIGDLLAPHNEHRIVFTRLLTLLHLELAGEWNTRLEMILCAVVHTALITWLAALLMPLIVPRRRILFAGFIAVVFALPIGYENALLGFNFHFYLTLLFGIAAIVAFARARPFSPLWFSGLVGAICSYLSFSSSGVAAILTAVILVCLQLATKVRNRGGREYASVALLSLTAVAMLLWEMSVTTGSNVGLWSFMLGFLFLAGPTVLGVIGIQGPAIWFCWDTLTKRPDVNDRAWVAMGIVGWVAVQLAIVAYGRGTTIGVRYMDILLPVYPVALMAVFKLADASFGRRLNRYAKRAAVAWVFIVVTLISTLGYYMAILQAVDWNKSAQQQMMNAQAYISTHNNESLKNKDQHLLVDVAFPNLIGFAHILDDPDVRSIMPPEIRPADADNAGARNRMWLKGSLAKATSTAVRGMLAIGPALLAVGVGMFFGVATRRTNR